MRTPGLRSVEVSCSFDDNEETVPNGSDVTRRCRHAVFQPVRPQFHSAELVLHQIKSLMGFLLHPGLTVSQLKDFEYYTVSFGNMMHLVLGQFART